MRIVLFGRCGVKKGAYLITCVVAGHRAELGVEGVGGDLHPPPGPPRHLAAARPRLEARPARRRVNPSRQHQVLDLLTAVRELPGRPTILIPKQSTWTT